MATADLTLYDIQDGLREAVEAFEAACEQCELVANESDQVREVAQQSLDLATQSLKAYLAEEVKKVDGIAGYIRHCDAMHALCDEEIDRLVKRAESWKRRKESLKAMVLGIMQDFDRPKFETATSCIRRQKNGGTVAPVIYEPAAVPAGYIRVTVQMSAEQWSKVPAEFHQNAKVREREFLMAMIGAALDRGEDVPGARKGERGEHLRIG